MSSTRIKAGYVIGLLLLALVGGLYFSGWLALAFLKLPNPTKLTTYWEYWKAIDLPQVRPYAMKLKAAGAVGFGLPLLAWALLLIPLLKTREKSLHGDASFAEIPDLKKARLLAKAPEGLLLGNFRGHDIYLGGPQHAIVTAATRTGKTAGIVIPVLKTYTHSVVCADLKGELFQLTSAERKAMGHEIFKFSPYDEKGETHRFNPFTALPDDPRTRFAEVQSIAAILYPDEAGKDPFWISMARGAFTAFASFMFEEWDQWLREGYPGMDKNANTAFPSFERILHLSSGRGGDSTQVWLGKVLKDKERYGFISNQTRTTFSNLASLAEQTHSSVIATMQAPLQQFLSPILAAATNASDFDVSDLRKKLMTIYMVIPPKKLGESSKLMNIFFSVAIGNNLDKTPQEDKSNKHQVLMLMDEFATMGRVDIVADRISIMAGYGVRVLAIVQSRSQLRSVYGADIAQSLITNFGVSVVFTPREQEDANEYSELLGYRTIRKRHRSTSRGVGGGNVSYHYTEERRALMLPQELKELPKDDLLIFYEGCKPIRGKKNWWFKIKRFKASEKPPVAIPKLKVMGSAETSKGQQA
jgi:type IV secretion system protein VirD4